jgi:hypothetical protein
VAAAWSASRAFSYTPALSFEADFCALTAESALAAFASSVLELCLRYLLKARLWELRGKSRVHEVYFATGQPQLVM